MFLLRFRLLVLALGVLCTLTRSAQAQYSISGTVTDPNTVPVLGVDVFLYDDTGGAIGIPPTVTDEFGFYSIGGLPPATYGVGFEPPSATHLLPALITPVVVTSDVTLDVTLALGNLLSGFVRDTAGVGIVDIDLNVYDQATGDKLNTPGDNTDVDGFYDVVVPTGTFRLRWRSLSGEPWVPVQIENVVIAADTTIDVTMVTGFFVSGTVLDTLGSPVVDADLDFADSVTGQDIFTPKDNTNDSGWYEVIVPAGTYNIAVEPRVVDRLVSVEIINVPVQKDTTVNFTLEPGLSLSGTVTDSAGSGVPAVDIDVFYTASGEKVLTPSDNTDSIGQYEIIVPSGLLDIEYEPPVSSYLAPVAYDSVLITGDTIIDVTVPDGILLSGTVQNTGGFGIEGIDIDAKDATTGMEIPLSGDHTDSIGAFAMIMVPGAYHLEFEPPKVFRLAAQRLLGVSLTQDTSILITLDTGVSVSGTVTDSAGTPVPDADVSAIISSSGDTVFTPGDNTDTLGFYEIVIPPDTYHLLYVPDSLSGITDSVLLTNVVVANDTVINVSFSGTGSDVTSPSVTVTAPNGGEVWAIGSTRNITWNATDNVGVTSIDLYYSNSGASGPYISIATGETNDGIYSWMVPDDLTTNAYVAVMAHDAAGNSGLDISDAAFTIAGSCCVGNRGNVNDDGGDDTNVADLTYLVDYLFRAGSPPPCYEEGDVNGDGNINVADLTYIVDYLFRAGTPPPPCP